MEKHFTHQRLDVVDALRGFALASIIILHNIEHFDLYFHPRNLPSWLSVLDKSIWNVVFLLFNGKSYGIFSLLFGFTFYLQYNKQLEKGIDFRLRFAWRMVILFLFGIINTAFFEGDILTFYAVIGLLLIPMANLRTSILLFLAALLLFNPIAWFNILNATTNTGEIVGDPKSWQFFNQAKTYLQGESITSTWIGNLTNGKLAIFYWFWETGRFVQTPALFILGMVIGRKALFYQHQEKARRWKKILTGSILATIPLFLLKLTLPHWQPNITSLAPAHQIITLWFNFSMMLMTLSLFVWLWQKKQTNKFLSIFAPMGRMSLTNYILQSMMGAYIYHGFGLGLYQYTGAFYSLLIAITCITFQIIFSKWWFITHKQGPLEYLWHKLTWLSYSPCRQLINKLQPTTSQSR